MKKGVIWGIILALLIGLIAFGVYRERIASQTSATGKPIVRIGVIQPLTKNNTLSGNTYKELYQMRISDIPSSSKYEYKLFIEDDQFEPAKSITASKKLMDINNVDIMFASASGAEMSIVDTADKEKTIMLTHLWNEDIPKKSKYAFLFIPLPEKYAEVLVEELKKRNIKTVSILVANHQGAIMASDAFKKAAIENGLDVIDEQKANMGTSDWSILVSKMNNKNPDIYFAMLDPIGTETWGKELKKQEVSTSKVIAINMFDFILDKALFEGAWYASDSFINPEFSAEYRARYDKELEFTQALWGYATLEWIIDIYESYDEKPTTDQVVADLLSGEHESVVGRISYDKDGIMQGKPILKIIKNGKAVLLEE